jgi:hypothetical protein
VKNQELGGQGQTASRTGADGSGPHTALALSAATGKPLSRRSDSSRCRRARCSCLLCYFLSALGGVTRVLVADQGEHVAVVLGCCRGKTVLCDSDPCCYLLQRQRGHACIIAAGRCAAPCRSPSPNADGWQWLAAMPSYEQPARLARTRMASGTSMSVSRASACCQSAQAPARRLRQRVRQFLSGRGEEVLSGRGEVVEGRWSAGCRPWSMASH